MEEESRLIKLMANFPACDLREVYFQRWKEIFSEAVEFEKELQALRSWKEQRLKDTDPKIEHLVQTLAKKVEELEAWKEKARPLLGDFHNMIFRHDDKDYYKRRIEILTELLGE